MSNPTNLKAIGNGVLALPRQIRITLVVDIQPDGNKNFKVEGKEVGMVGDVHGFACFALIHEYFMTWYLQNLANEKAQQDAALKLASEAALSKA